MTDQVAPSPQSLCDHPVYVHHARGGEPLTIPLCQLCGEIGWDDLREQVAERRRLVLGEAADELTSEIEWQREKYGDGSSKVGVGRLIGMEDARATLRRLAVAAPPAGPSVTVPAENASAVPEDTPHPFAELGRQAIESCRAFADALAEAYGPAFSSLARAYGAPPVPEEADGQRAAEGDALTYAEMESERDRLAEELYQESLLLADMTADRDRLAAQVERVRALHTPELFAGVQACLACSPGMPPQVLIEWPCPTIAAVDALPDARTDQTEDNHGH